MEQEEWRDIPGFDGRYQASSLGRIKSLPRTVRCGNHRRTTRERIMKLTPDNGYLAVGLRNPEGKPVRGRVHQFVCLAFHARPEGNYHVAHNDGDPTNNRADNLRWATPLENVWDKAAHGTMLRGERVASAKLGLVEVREIRSGFLRFSESLGAFYGVAPNTIEDVIFRRTWKHVG